MLHAIRLQSPQLPVQQGKVKPHFSIFFLWVRFLQFSSSAGECFCLSEFFRNFFYVTNFFVIFSLMICPSQCVALDSTGLEPCMPAIQGKLQCGQCPLFKARCQSQQSVSVRWSEIPETRPRRPPPTHKHTRLAQITCDYLPSWPPNMGLMYMAQAAEGGNSLWQKYPLMAKDPGDGKTDIQTYKPTYKQNMQEWFLLMHFHKQCRGCLINCERGGVGSCCC